MERKAKTIPNITAEAVASTRKRMRRLKDIGTYIKMRAKSPQGIMFEIFVTAVMMHNMEETAFREFFDVIHTACVRTDMYRLYPNFTENAEKSHVRGESFGGYEGLIEDCERRITQSTDDMEMYAKARKTTTAVYRIVKSRLKATLYKDYPRIRRVLETHSNIHINV